MEDVMFSRRFLLLLFGLTLVVAVLACDIFDSTEPTEEPALGSISGVMWHEKCSFIDGSPPVLGEGCVEWSEGETWGFGPNQVYDEFESGWVGVTLHLGAGACPSTGLDTTATNAFGEYSFDNLNAGTYCVSYSAHTDGNDTILIPGGPTFPFRGEDGYYRTIELAPGENKIDVDFGFAWQFYD